MPVQNGAAATCRKPDVRFVRVTSSIDFAPLITIAIAGPTVLRSQYYLELPQSTLPLLNGAGTNYNLTTWHGAADLSTLSAHDVRLHIFDVVLQDGPIALLQADFTPRFSSWVSIRLPTVSFLNCALTTVINLMPRWIIFGNLVLARMASR